MIDFSQITPQWITAQMLEFDIKHLKQLSIEVGIRYDSLTMAMNGKRKMSGEIKKSLYWYFMYRDLQRQFANFST